MTIPRDRPKGPEDEIPDREHGTEVAISFGLPARVMDPVQIRGYDEVLEGPVEGDW
jgi:hypothetical protein